MIVCIMYVFVHSYVETVVFITDTIGGLSQNIVNGKEKLFISGVLDLTA